MAFRTVLLNERANLPRRLANRGGQPSMRHGNKQDQIGKAYAYVHVLQPTIKPHFARFFKATFCESPPSLVQGSRLCRAGEAARPAAAPNSETAMKRIEHASTTNKASLQHSTRSSQTTAGFLNC